MKETVKKVKSWKKNEHEKWKEYKIDMKKEKD